MGSIISKLINKLAQEGLQPFGIYYGFYRAFVTDVDDPLKLNRLKLCIPVILDDLPHPDWAFPIGNFSSKGYGTKILPKVGDMVWVSFENGKPELPLWQHGHFGENEAPRGEDYKDNDSYYFKSPKGNEVIINDTKSCIYIRHTDGNQIKIDKDYISLKATKTSLSKIGASNEPAVLGDKNEKVLEEIRDCLKTITQAIALDTAASAAATQPYLLYTNLTAAVPQLLQSLISISAKIPTTKSNKVTLD